MAEEKSSDQTKRLADSFLDFADKLISRARQHVIGHGLPNRVEYCFSFEPPAFTGPAATGSSIAFRRLEKADYRGFLLFNRDQWAHPEAERCAREHFAYGVVRSRLAIDEKFQSIQNPSFEDLKQQLVYDAYYALAGSCERHRTLELTDEQIRETYRRLKSEWFGPSVTWQIASPLTNFKTEKCGRIGSVLEIVSLSHGEKTELWNHDSEFGPLVESQVMGRGEFARALFKLCGTDSSRRDDLGIAPEIRDEVVRVLTALRLLKSGDIGAPGILACSTSTGIIDRFMSQFVFDGRTRNSGHVYELLEGDWETFGRLYGALQTIPSNLQMALRRFNQAYGRILPEDALIDLTIALEICLLPNATDELLYRLSLRGAALLADSRNPTETQLLLKTLYEARSKIVHSGKNLSDAVSRGKVERLGVLVEKGFLQACENVTREVLRECVLRVSRAGPLAQIIEELDRSILRGFSASPP